MAGSKVRQSSTLAPLLFAVIFGLGGLLAGKVLLLDPLSGWWAARGWVAASCEITEAGVGRHDSNNGTTWSPELTYRYLVDGVAGSGSDIDFSPSDHGSSDRASAERFVAEHAVGTTHPCFVDPTRPNRAVLDRSMGFWILWGLFPAPFLGVAVYLGSRAFRKTPLRAVEVAVNPPSAPVPDGPLELRRASDPAVSGVGMLVFGLIWVTFSAWALAAAYDPCSRAFLVLFVVVGIGLLLGAVHSIGKGLNPVAVLVVSPSNLAPGSSFDVMWRLEGRAERVERLRLELVGEERATYRRGTDTTTVTERFHHAVLAEVEGEEVASGIASATVPADAVPSFQSANNRIRWYLRIEGTVRRWPDIDDEFELTVGPGAMGGAP